MNTQKLTSKSIEAIHEAQNLAQDRHHQELHQEHLLLALVEQEDGLIRSMLSPMGIQPQVLENALEEKLSRIPSVTGTSRAQGQFYVTQEMDDALYEAEKQA